MSVQITAAQLKKLQTLWGIAWKAGTVQLEVEGQAACIRGEEREARILWLTSTVKRPLQSSKELTKNEAEIAIRELAKCVPEHLRGKRLSKARAHQVGTAGRKGEPQSMVMASAEEFRRIDYLISQLGWERARYEAWLRSTRSPLKGRAEIRTLDDANKVKWALKGILRYVQKRGAA